MDVASIERLLETYTLEEILEENELSEADILFYLVEQEFIRLPNILPVDYE